MGFLLPQWRVAGFALFVLAVAWAGKSEGREVPKVMTRGEWGAMDADLPKLAKLPMGEIRYLSVHQTETPHPDRVDEIRRLRGIQSWHQAHEGGPQWGDIAYHYLIGPSGTIYEGRSESTAPSSGTIYLTEAQWEAAGQDEQGKTTAAKPGGSAKPGASAGHLTICFLGTYHDALPTQEAQDAFLWLAREKMNEHEIPLERVLFHREIACWTDCPGQALYDWFRGPERRRGMLGPGLKKLQAYQSKEKL